MCVVKLKLNSMMIFFLIINLKSNKKKFFEQIKIFFFMKLSHAKIIIIFSLHANRISERMNFKRANCCLHQHSINIFSFFNSASCIPKTFYKSFIKKIVREECENSFVHIQKNQTSSDPKILQK